MRKRREKKRKVNFSHFVKEINVGARSSAMASSQSLTVYKAEGDTLLPSEIQFKDSKVQLHRKAQQEKALPSTELSP